MTESAPRPLYRETTHGMPRWIGVLLVGGGCVGVLLILQASREYHRDALFWLGALPGLAAAIFVPLILAMWKLDTQVHPGLLVVRLRPFTTRRIPLTEVESCEPRRYNAIREYLGWGWRFGPGGRALTVIGRQGVQMVLRGGERLLISSARPERLAEAIRSARG